MKAKGPKERVARVAERSSELGEKGGGLLARRRTLA
jgi:hypothetical protein